MLNMLMGARAECKAWSSQVLHYMDTMLLLLPDLTTSNVLTTEDEEEREQQRFCRR